VCRVLHLVVFVSPTRDRASSTDTAATSRRRQTYGG